MDLSNRIFYSVCLASSVLGSIYMGSIYKFFLVNIICFLAYAEIYHMKLKDNVHSLCIVSLSIFNISVSLMTTEVLLTFLSIVWSTDIASYAVGNLIGGTKLYVSISPNKTISGVIGGLAFGMFSLPGLHKYLSLIMPLKYLGPPACFYIALLAIVGDLCESGIKRMCGLKDSNLVGIKIPGHGGILDRIDALILSAPLAFLLMK